MPRLKNHLPNRARNHKILCALGQDLHVPGMRARLNVEPWCDITRSHIIKHPWCVINLIWKTSLKQYASDTISIISMKNGFENVMRFEPSVPLISWHCLSIFKKAFFNGACHPGGHYWDYYPGTLSSIQVTAALLKVRHMAVNPLRFWQM